jgi:hypothetical protein
MENHIIKTPSPVQRWQFRWAGVGYIEIVVGFPTDSLTFKISMREYEDMAIKVGDKVIIEIKKADAGGI